jgi:hypothetical protein
MTVFYFKNPRKVRTAKAERRTFGRFFFRFPNGEAGLDVYNRVSSFLATMSRDLLQMEAAPHVDMANLNILIVTHGLTLRLLLMRYFQLSVEEFEQSYNSQNAKLVVIERIEIPSSSSSDGVEGNNDNEEEEGQPPPQPRVYFRLQEAAKEALNLKGDVSNAKPVYWRGDAMDHHPYGDSEEK